MTAALSMPEAHRKPDRGLAIARTKKGAVRRAATVQELLGEARELHRTVAVRSTEALRQAVAVGRLLSRVKDSLPHGSFLPRLEEIGIPRRTASKYRLLAKWARRAHLGDLTIEQAYALARAARSEATTDATAPDGWRYLARLRTWANAVEKESARALRVKSDAPEALRVIQQARKSLDRLEKGLPECTR